MVKKVSSLFISILSNCIHSHLCISIVSRQKPIRTNYTTFKCVSYQKLVQSSEFWQFNWKVLNPMEFALRLLWQMSREFTFRMKGYYSVLNNISISLYYGIQVYNIILIVAVIALEFVLHKHLDQQFTYCNKWNDLSNLTIKVFNKLQYFHQYTAFILFNLQEALLGDYMIFWCSQWDTALL